MPLALLIRTLLGLTVAAFPVVAQEAPQSEREAIYYRYLEFPSLVKDASIQPHWMTDGSSFWYAEGAPANTIIYQVNAGANTKLALFHTARLRQALIPLLGHEPPYKGLPFDKFTFVGGGKGVRFAIEQKEFILELATYAIARAPALSEEEKKRLTPQVLPNPSSPYTPTSPSSGGFTEILSPDRRWFVGVKENNLWLRSTHDGRSVQLTTDGIEDCWWDNHGARWSRDNFRLAATKVDFRNIRKIPIVYYLKPYEEVEWVYPAFPKPGERLASVGLFIIDIPSKQQVRVDTGEEAALWFDLNPGWQPDGSELLFLRMNREGKKLDLLAASPATGVSRVVLTETQKTFVIGFEWRVLQRLFTWLPDGKRFIWMSERDGWRHLYLYDINGTLIRRLTGGAFPVVEVVAIDEKTGWVYFTAHGDQQRPYDTHLYRVNLEGRGFARLTEGNGQHEIQFAPSKEFFIDTHSTVARPPVVELRRADGTLLQVLSKANIDALKELKWKPPEEFVVKAADEKTDLYGVLFKPFDFDPNKRYPVIECIYGGPQASVVPNAFIPSHYGGMPLALAQLGFIVFMVDGRGTPERGNAFQDVVYENPGRNEIPDHVATLKQLSEKRPYMDLSRVGIFGLSFGGYMTTRAMLLAPDVYQVGIASAGPQDAGAGILVFYLGLPQKNKEAYEYTSNLGLAGKLKGKLLLIHGTSDNVVPLSETMKIADALIRAGRPFDLLVLPGQGHGLRGTSAYWAEAHRRYFQEHLKP